MQLFGGDCSHVLSRQSAQKLDCLRWERDAWRWQMRISRRRKRMSSTARTKEHPRDSTF